MLKIFDNNNLQLEIKEKTDKGVKSLSVWEILLLNKSSGLPIFSRVYKETSGKDPTLIAGLMAAIVQFGEMIGNNMELNDIGIRAGSRIFIRTHNDLVCLLTIGNFSVSQVTSSRFVEVINELSSRIFETIQMMVALPVFESGGALDELDLDFTEDSSEEQNMSIFPELGQMVDNIILETTTMFNLAEDEETIDLEALVEKELGEMEEFDSTYLKSEYSGTTQEIRKNKTTKTQVRNFFSIFERYGNIKG